MFKTTHPSEYIPSCFLRAPDEAKSALAFGVDLSLLEENLTLTHEERILKHQSLLEVVQELKKAGAQLKQ